MSKATYTCQSCKQPFEARTADRARGWARFCSKSCKAIKQEARTGQNAAHRKDVHDAIADKEALYQATGGWDEHKDWI